MNPAIVDHELPPCLDRAFHELAVSINALAGFNLRTEQPSDGAMMANP